MRTYILMFLVLLVGSWSTGWRDGHVAGTIPPWDEPHIATALLHTNQPHTPDAPLSQETMPVSIGEIVTYETTVTIPGGAYPAARFAITLGSGLALVDVLPIDASPGLVSDAPGGWAGVLTRAEILDAGQRAVLDLGTVTDTAAAQPETLTLRYRVVVLNTFQNGAGAGLDSLHVRAMFEWKNMSVQQYIEKIHVVEPSLGIQHNFEPATARAGELVRVTLRVAHPVGEDGADPVPAFDAYLHFALPGWLRYQPDSFAWTGQGEEPLFVSDTGSPELRAAWEVLPPGSESSLIFHARLSTALAPGETVTETAHLTWTGLPGTVRTPQSAYNALSVERTGSPREPGGAVNDYAATTDVQLTLPLPATLRVQKSAMLLPNGTGSGPLAAGDPLRYTIRLENSGAGALTGVQLRDHLVPSLTFLPGTLNAPGATVLSGNHPADRALRLDMADLAPGGVVTITLDVALTTAITNEHVLANRALVRSDPLPLVVSTASSEDEYASTPTRTYVDAGPHLHASQTIVRAPDEADGAWVEGAPGAGDTVRYAVVIENRGRSPATGVSLHSTMDPSVTLLADTITGAAGAERAGGMTSAGDLQVAVGTIAPGVRATVGYSVRINEPLLAGVSRITNQAIVLAQNAPALLTDDPTTPVVDDATVLALGNRPMLAAHKSAWLWDDVDGTGTPSPGDVLAYRVTIANRGYADATDVVFTDGLASYTHLIPGSVQSSQGAVSTDPQLGDEQVRVVLGTIAQQGRAAARPPVQVSYLARIDSELPAGITELSSQGAVQSALLEPVQTDDPDTPAPGDATRVALRPTPHLHVAKRALLLYDANGDDAFSPGDRLLYHITLVNRGLAPATGVVLEDWLDPNLQLDVGSAGTERGRVIGGNTAGDEHVLVEVGTIAGVSVAGDADRVTVWFVATLRTDTTAPRVSNQARVTLPASPNGEQGTGHLVILSDDPTTELLADPTVTRISLAPTALEFPPEELSGEPAPESLAFQYRIFVPLVRVE